MKSITLEFDGYWREVNKGGVPAKSGVYCVYACTYNNVTEKVLINKLLYIGESGDVQERIANHDRHDDWMEFLSPEQTLCYSFAPVPSGDRERAEAALIFKMQPPYNTEHAKEFIYTDTEIVTSGQSALLPERFTVRKGDKHYI